MTKDIPEKLQRAKKMMLWLTMGSIVMVFAGLTSAYVVSSSREDWIKDFSIPATFYISTVIIIISSITFHLAKLSVIKNRNAPALVFLLLTLGLGIVFAALQFIGFGEFISQGYYFTGTQSNVTTSFVYLIVLVHLLHLFGGIIALLIIIYNHYSKKYKPLKTLGLDLGLYFWDFLGVLWIYLILFFTFSG